MEYPFNSWREIVQTLAPLGQKRYCNLAQPHASNVCVHVRVKLSILCKAVRTTIFIKKISNLTLEHNRDKDDSPKSLPVDKFVPVNRVYQYISHPYVNMTLFKSLCSLLASQLEIDLRTVKVCCVVYASPAACHSCAALRSARCRWWRGGRSIWCWTGAAHRAADGRSAGCWCKTPTGSLASAPTRNKQKLATIWS